MESLDTHIIEELIHVCPETEDWVPKVSKLLDTVTKKAKTDQKFVMVKYFPFHSQKVDIGAGK